MKYTTIGYHTVEDRGNPEFIKANAPFKCTRGDAWLSHGFYFWDEDFKRAKDWGEKAYKKNGYVICECTLKLLKMFDLAGRIKYQGMYLEYINILKTKFPVSKDTPIGEVIALLRAYNQIGIVFDYDSVRASDSPRNTKTKFVQSRPETSDLNKRIQICLFDKSPINLQGLRIVSPNKYC